MDERIKPTEYIAVVLAGCHANIFAGDRDALKRTVSLAIDYAPLLQVNNIVKPGQVPGIADSSDAIVKKFLQHVDNMLELFVESRPLPVFVFGTGPAIEHFKEITYHRALITDFFPVNCKDITDAAILKAMQPYFLAWPKIKEASLLVFFENAFGKGKAYAGIQEVYARSLQKMTWLLIVEKNFTSQALNLCHENPGVATNDVDVIIDNIEANGGMVELVEDGSLKGYHHIGITAK